MEAIFSTRVGRPVLIAVLLLVCMGARSQTANYIVETADPTLAPRIAQAAEKLRHDMAVEWLGQAMPNWAQPCMMTVQVGPHLGAGGATTFVFDRGEVFGWRMTIQGSAERIFDSVLPHEITHMVYASHFRQPLPRWADEGGATSVEHVSERQKHRTMLLQFLRTNRGIAFNQMFAMTDYPRDIMPLYAQGYALAEFLIQRGGRREYIAFLADGLKGGQWPAAVKRHYGINDLNDLQNTWVTWVAQGFPDQRPAAAVVAAAATTSVATVSPVALGSDRRVRPEPNLIYHMHDKGDPGPQVVQPVPYQAPNPTGAGAPPPVANPTTAARPQQ